MKYRASLLLSVSLILVLVTALPVASQQITPSASLTALSPTEAFEILNALNKKGQLVPASFLIPATMIKTLTAENSFGIRTPQGLRLVGYSSGRDVGLRGSITPYQGQKRVMVFIGVLYSEFPFLLQAKSFPAGPYMVMALRDALQLQGDDPSGTHYDVNRGRQVPNSLEVEIPLPSPIPDELLAEKAAAVPRFSMSIENNTIFLTVLDNRLPIMPK